MGSPHGAFVNYYGLVLQIVPSLVLAVVAILAYLRLRLASLWWLFAAQVWALALPWLERLIMPVLMRGRMGMGMGGVVLWPMYAAETVVVLIPFALLLVFMLLLIRDVSSLLVCLPPPAEASPLPLTPNPPPAE